MWLVLTCRKAAPSTSSLPAPRHSSSRSYLRCLKSMTGPPSQWWPHVTTDMRTSWLWWREWRMVPLLAGRKRAWWSLMWRMTLAEPGLNGYSKTTKPRWGTLLFLSVFIYKKIRRCLLMPIWNNTNNTSNTGMMISPGKQSFFNTPPSSSLLIFLGRKTSVAEGLAVRYLPRLYNDPFPAVTSASNFYVFGITAERHRGAIFIYQMILTADTVLFACLFPQLFNDWLHFSR